MCTDVGDELFNKKETLEKNVFPQAELRIGLSTYPKSSTLKSKWKPQGINAGNRLG